VRVALLQMNGSDEPADNLARLERLAAEAVNRGATFLLSPEVSNIVSSSRRILAERTTTEAADPMLARAREIAAEHRLWFLLGSLALRLPGENRLANRSILIGPDGAICARYDKIHMFDVTLSESDSYRESHSFRPGERAVIARTGFARIGLSICYDLRFPGLYRKLAKAGATILAIPAAFTVPTGRAHWRTLLRARAIENGAFVLAPAQTGNHRVSAGRPRASWGHSLVVDPWGEVLAEGGTDEAVLLADIDFAAVDKARARVPSLDHDRAFTGPVIEECGHAHPRAE